MVKCAEKEYVLGENSSNVLFVFMTEM